MSETKQALPHPTRRVFLSSAGAFVAWANMPRLASAAGTRDPRLVVIILRGAMDGLAAVPPVGDPDYAAIRGDLAIGTPGLEPTLALDSFFGLNRAMPKLYDTFKQGQALIVHASATAYRDRSHFDGQDVLETGMTAPRAADTGWLNRVAQVLPAGPAVEHAGLAASPTVPLILRGPAPILTWTPPDFRPAGSDTLQRLMQLYGETDKQLAQVLSAGIGVDKLAAGDDLTMAAGKRHAGHGVDGAFASLAAGAGRLLADNAGPRLAAISYVGWDTHASEGADKGRLATLLGALDGAIAALKNSMKPVWNDTAVVLMTEFGRTAHINGTDGTDHGTATTAFLVGGAVRGGRVVADWPGLKPQQLYQQRDLKPTTDLRAVLKGVLRDHLGVSERALSKTVFPDSTAVKPLDGLIA